MSRVSKSFKEELEREEKMRALLKESTDSEQVALLLKVSVLKAFFNDTFNLKMRVQLVINSMQVLIVIAIVIISSLNYKADILLPALVCGQLILLLTDILLVFGVYKLSEKEHYGRIDSLNHTIDDSFEVLGGIINANEKENISRDN